MKKIFFAIAALALVSFAHTTHAAQESIAAVVNEDAISASDVAARTRLMVVSAGLPDNAEMRAHVLPQVIDALIDERIMIQAGAKNKVTITDADIEKGFETISGQNKFTVEQFKGILHQQKIPVKTIEDQIRSQMAWTHVVQTVLRPKVEVTDFDVDAALQRLEAQKGKTQYLVAEIYLPVDNTRKEADVSALAQRLTQEITQNHAPFPRVAAQFSAGAGAARGGDRGWVLEGQLPQELDTALASMNEGDLSRPIRTLSGYYILMVRKKNILTDETMPNRDTVFEKLGLEQLDRLQRGYLMDLRAAAFIDRRNGV